MSTERNETVKCSKAYIISGVSCFMIVNSRIVKI